VYIERKMKTDDFPAFILRLWIEFNGFEPILDEEPKKNGWVGNWGFQELEVPSLLTRPLTPFLSTMAPKKSSEPIEGARRSTRIASNPTATAAAPAASKRKADDAEKPEPKKPAKKEKAESASASAGQLKVGDSLPKETLVDEEGKEIEIAGEYSASGCISTSIRVRSIRARPPWLLRFKVEAERVLVISFRITCSS